MICLIGNKKGMSTSVMNWIFVTIAGAVILIFIFKIIHAQGQITELEASSNLLEDLGGVLVGRSVSENSFSEIKIPSDKIFIFKCDGFCNKNVGCRSYVTTASKGKRIDTSVRPIFSPEKIKFTNKIYSFVYSWKIPFNVVNFVYLSYPGEQIVLDCRSNSKCDDIKSKIPEKLFRAKIVVDISKESTHFKFKKHIYFKSDTECNTLINSVSSSDKKHMVCVGDSRIFFEDKGDKKSYYYLTDEEILAAMFTEDSKTYECNMRKAEYKYNKAVEIYTNRVNSLKPFNTRGNCDFYYNSNILTLLNSYKIKYDQNQDLFDQLKTLKSSNMYQKMNLLNLKLARNGCSQIY